MVLYRYKFYYYYCFVAISKYKIKLSFLIARSLLSSFNEFKDYFEKAGSDIIAVTETWLNDKIENSVIMLDEISLLKVDRGRRGEGALYLCC